MKNQIISQNKIKFVKNVTQNVSPVTIPHKNVLNVPQYNLLFFVNAPKLFAVAVKMSK
jgi:hypothetical protein